MSIEECQITVGDLPWFYRQVIPSTPNDKSPVVLLHGLPAQSYSWRGVMPALADYGFRAIAPDWIGFGFSAKPSTRTFAYTPEAFISAFGDWLAALELSRFSLVVQGFLGTVGLQYALRHPDQIDRLVILNAPIATTARLPWKIQQFSLPLIGDMLTQDPILVDRTLEGGSPYQVADADLDVYRRPFLKSSDAGRSLLQTVKKLNLPQVTTEIEQGLATWQHPTLLLWGDRDPWLPLTLAEYTTTTMTNAELVQLTEVGHYPQEDWHEKVSEAMIPFLRRQVV